MDERGLDILSADVLDVPAGGPALVELESDVSVTVAGYVISLGTLSHTFATVRLLNGEEMTMPPGTRVVGPR